MKLPAKEITKIAIFRALQLGDMLCAIPAIRALRQAYPQASITLLGLPWGKSLMDRFPNYIDAFIHFPGYPGLPEQPFDAWKFHEFMGIMLQKRFDLVLQMQGNGSIVNPMVELLGGKHTAGFCLKDDYCPDRQLFLEYPNGIHEIERHLKLMQHLGLQADNTDLEFPLFPKDEEDFKQAGLPVEAKNYVCVHPGSRGSWRQWPTEYFAAMADYCFELGLKVVITGTKEEMEIVEKVANKMKNMSIIAAGKTSLGAVGVLIKNAFALISNCTGVAHLAAAFKTPSIVLSMDGEPERWTPLNKEIHRTIDWIKSPDFSLAMEALKSLFHLCTQRDHFRDEVSARTFQ